MALLWTYIFKVNGQEEIFYDRSLDGAKKQFEEKFGREPLKSDFVKRGRA